MEVPLVDIGLDDAPLMYLNGTHKGGVALEYWSPLLKEQISQLGDVEAVPRSWRGVRSGPRQGSSCAMCLPARSYLPSIRSGSPGGADGFAWES